MFPSPQSILQSNIIFPVKYNIEPQSHLLFFFLLRLFLLSLTKTIIDAAKSSGASKDMYSKIFTRYAVHCLARVEKSRMGKFHCLLSILLGHRAYNYISQLNEPEIFLWHWGKQVWDISRSHCWVLVFSETGWPQAQSPAGIIPGSSKCPNHTWE